MLIFNIEKRVVIVVSLAFTYNVFPSCFI